SAARTRTPEPHGQISTSADADRVLDQEHRLVGGVGKTATLATPGEAGEQHDGYHDRRDKDQKDQPFAHGSLRIVGDQAVAPLQRRLIANRFWPFGASLWSFWPAPGM